ANLIGMQAVYLDAGSGAERPVSPEVIRACRAAVPKCALFVGGGIRTPALARAARQAAADFVVIGTVIEEGPQGELGKRGALGGLAALAGQVAAEQADQIAAIADRFEGTLRLGGTLFFAGNGGSAADAQHVATEYVVRYQTNRPAMRAVALTTDTSLLTACAN